MSPAWQANSLPTESSGKPLMEKKACMKSLGTQGRWIIREKGNIIWDEKPVLSSTQSSCLPFSLICSSPIASHQIQEAWFSPAFCSCSRHGFPYGEAGGSQRLKLTWGFCTLNCAHVHAYRRLLCVCAFVSMYLCLHTCVYSFMNMYAHMCEYLYICMQPYKFVFACT